MTKKEYTEIISNRYVVVFRVEEDHITVFVYDKEVGDAAIGFQRYKNPAPMEDPEFRKEFAETAVKTLEFLRKHYQCKDES